MPFTPDKPASGFVPDSTPQNIDGDYQNKSLAEKIHEFPKLLDQVTPEMLSQAAKHPVTGMEDPAYSMGVGMVVPSNPLAGLGSMLRKGGDVLMQKAVGATRYVPGVGEQLANAGFMGTKAGMTADAVKKMQQAGEQIGQLASQIPGKIPQEPVANEIANLVYKPGSRSALMTESGYVRPEEQRVVDKLLGKAQDFSSSEPLSGTEMAARRAQAGRAAREAKAYAPTPSTSVKAQLAAAEQAGYSRALKEAYSSAFPGATNPMADADQLYSTSSNAYGMLTRPESMGTATNFASQLIPTKLIESVAGRSLIGAGKAAQRVPRTAPVSALEQMLKPKVNDQDSE